MSKFFMEKFHQQHIRDTIKRNDVLVVGDSLLKGTETSICWSDRNSQELYCLPGAKIWDIAERVLQLVKSTECYSLLLFHVGMDDAVILGRIKEDYKALGVKVKNFSAKIIFSLLFTT